MLIDDTVGDDDDGDEDDAKLMWKSGQLGAI